MSKIRKIFTSIILIFALAAFWWFAPFTIKDPANPLYNPSSFSFRFIMSREKAVDTFSKLFPPGTDKAFVDQVLIEEGGAKVFGGYNEKYGYKNTDVRFFIYTEPWIYAFKTMIQPPSHTFMFTSNGHLVNAHAQMTSTVFRDMPSYDEAEGMTIEKLEKIINDWKVSHGNP
ncbi:MAG: hypothetical protein AB7E85_08040 [Pseudobdellovibrionaceae bacterium]